MPETINQLAAQITSSDDENQTASLRMGVVTTVEAVAPFRVKTDTTSTAWLSRDRDTVLAVGDRVWMIQQNSVWLVGGRLSGGQATPIGVINSFAGSTAPDGWLLCNGAAVSRTTYAALFAVLGTTYGTGDGSTTFNVPNLVNRMPVASGGTYTRGATGGAATVTLTSGQVPSHNHGGVGDHNHGSVGDHSHSYQNYSSGQRGTAAPTNTTSIIPSGTLSTGNAGGHSHGDSGGHTHSSFGGDGSHENMPPYLALPAIIRAL